MGKISRPLDLVDPFLGNEATSLPQAEGIAATWFWPKAQVGNTHPGACYPFGMVSACAYSGAYVTGYGLYRLSTDGLPSRLYDDYMTSAFSHFHPSGTGTIGSYLNYFRVTPLLGELDRLGTRWKLVNEVASPGYYAAGLAGTGIKAELTVARYAALHQYTFPASDCAQIAIDLSAGGIEIPDRDMKTVPSEAEFEVISSQAVEGKVVMEGVPIYFYIETDMPTAEWGIWVEQRPLPGLRAWSQVGITRQGFRPFGVYFKGSTGEGQRVRVKLGFSLRSVRQARDNAYALYGKTFEEVAAETRATWDAYLSRVLISGGTSAQQQIFYSALYHSLIKPCDCQNPYWDADGPYYVDLATMWDMYKTQLPLMLTVYPERGMELVNSLLTVAEHVGEFPIGYVLNSDHTQFNEQASALAHVTISDAYIRGLEGIDWQRALRLMEKTLRQGRGEVFIREGKVHPYTHTLDLAYACYCTAQIARDLGEQALCEEMMALSRNWRNVYDPRTGRLSEDSKYYEGGNWNYSFRLFHDMAGRIALYDREQAFVEDLDRFFGYGQPPCTQVRYRPYGDLMAKGRALNRFEGLNNEPDMETPYAYIYAGRPDRTAEVVRAVMKYQYATGRGGLPGNDDSGGTSSWYVWSALGLFPVAGQDVFLIGSPLFDAATIALGGATLTIEAKDNSDENIYVQQATWNGQSLGRAFLRYREIKAGGRLVLQMGPAPSDWGRRNRPPSLG